MNFIKLDDLEIHNRQLKGLVFDFNGDIYFYGLALDFEGKEICNRLSRFKLNSIVEVVAESATNSSEGVYKLYAIDIPSREEINGDRVIYRFSGKLAPIS